jgi:ankyrin repeat protein
VAYTYRPLTFRELQQAVTIDPYGGEGHDCDTQSATNLELVSPATLMEEVCMGLLTIDHHQNMVATIPLSLASYLRHFRKILFPSGEKYIATCIVSFLQHKRLAKPLETQTEYNELLKDLPFSAYASQYWGAHVREYWREDMPRLVSDILGRQLDAFAQFLHIFHPHFANQSDRLSYPRGFSAAHFAVYFNFQNGKDAVGRDTSDTWNRNVLHIACLQGHADQVENFEFDEEEHKLQPVTTTDIVDEGTEETVAPSSTPHSRTRLDVLCSFLEQMKDIDLDQKDKDGKTPLHYATISGNKPMVQSLLQHGADMAVLDESSWMPLDYAARENDLGIARYLLMQYTKTSDEASKPPGDSKALWIAASHGHRDMVRLLLRCKEISGQDRALLEAAKAGFFDIVRLLHRRRAKLFFQDEHSMTALHYAILTSNLEIVDYLMRDSDVNAVDQKGRSPLHLAAEIGDLDIVRQLIRRGAKIKANDKNGRTPLGVAVDNGNSDVVKLLLNYRDSGAILSGLRRTSTIDSDSDVNEKLGDRGAERDTDAGEAIPAQEERVAKEGFSQPHAPESKEAPPTRLTALQRACSTGNKAVVAALLGTGMNPNDTGTTFRTPLSYAAENGHEEVVKQLLETHRVDLNAADDHGRTPLSYATAHVQVFDLLFKEDASQRLPSFLRTQTRQLRDRLKSAVMVVNSERDAISHKWISLASIKDLIRDAEVVTTLHETSAETGSWTVAYIEALKDFILKKALRLFALLVSQEQAQLLELFCINDFGDEMFPIKLLEPDEGNETNRQNTPRWTIQSIAKQTKVSYRGQRVEDYDIEGICELWQWQFFVPVFSQNDPVYVFDPRCHMPFLRELETMETNFSVVRHFVIHRSHLDFRDINQIVRSHCVF